MVHRLASQDYAVETPNNQIDEIGDMAQAIRIFRENGLARQRLEKSAMPTGPSASCSRA
jgi:HAMP domain-containing protein